MNDENKPTFSDIRILSDDLIDLVKNINFKNSDLYEKNKYLEQELKKANERITDLLKNQSDLNLPADEGQGDSFLILGAIMETMNDFMSKRYGQTKHFKHIEQSFDAVGISESTMSKKVGKARQYFLKSATPKK